MFLFLKSKWSETGLRKWIWLFGFEFLVVLSGVLIAQMLQERFEQQRDKARFQTTLNVLNEQLRDAGTSLIIRSLQTECVQSNIAEIRGAIRSNSEDVSRLIFDDPPQPPAIISVWSSETAREARRYLSPDEVKSYDWISNLSDYVMSTRLEENKWWSQIKMAGDRLGNLTEDERSAVILATYNLEQAYATWEDAAPTIAYVMKQFEIEPELEIIKNMHDGKKVCAAEVRKQLPEFRKLVEQLGHGDQK